jgi:transketolase
LDPDQAEQALEELDVDEPAFVRLASPPGFVPPPWTGSEPDLPSYHDETATRDAFGAALAAYAAADPRIMVLDAEVADSTRTKAVAGQTPDQFLEVYIAEQAMIGAAVGLDAVGLRPVAATFAAFLTRAHDFIRMARISRSSMLVSGSHAGVSIGQDGPSQMGLDDIAMMRAIPDTTVLYPADGNATVALVGEALSRPGITYIRTTRGDTPHLYGSDQPFEIGGAIVLRSTPGDVATIVAAGVTLFEALDAADTLRDEGLPVRVIDAYSVAPIDETTLHRAADETGGIVTVEDHSTAGGLGDAVAEVVGATGATIHRLGVRSIPGSATPEEQRELAGIDAGAIAQRVRRIAGAA